MNVKQFEGLTCAEATARLLDRGWQKLGSGAAAYCFGKRGSGRVVKIVCGDRGQEAAVALFLQHPNEPSFPRIYSRADLAEKGCFIVEMERLREQPWNGTYGLPDNRMKIERSQTQRGGPLDRLLGSRAADLIRSEAEKIGEGIDLHADNLMLRKDGTLVAVDPLYVRANYQTRDKVRDTLFNHRKAA